MSQFSNGLPPPNQRPLRQARAHRTTPGSAGMPQIGKAVALSVLFILMALVVLLGFTIVVPKPLLDRVAMGDEFATTDQKIVVACAIFFIITLTLWVFDSVSLITFRNP